ncbi:hypothetical protein MWU75_11505 [Ornithinimicrobium sp. F0845]|uniref:hypothetical protein n=1 Tax=Ornithinimicrobium sp. F0845 TaxID=2926412 RepID=UPI001FF614EE|nr:hypothetical protein [Ornithinimicrobium sp. F0845]MCK0112766.1 hypothetical protein [Ornithinimicrobium sp. F0845]
MLLGTLAVVAISLTALAVWSVGSPSEAPTAGVAHALDPASSSDAAVESSAAPNAADTTGTATAADTPPTTLPAPTVGDWVSAWSTQDADLFVIGDGFSNLRSQWVHQWAGLVAAERPVQIHHWGEAADVSFNEADLISEGEGAQLTIWNASRADTTVSEAAGRTSEFLEAAGDVDAVMVSLGRESTPSGVAASLDQLVDEVGPDLPVLVVIGPPGLYGSDVADGILAWVEDHDERVSLVDLRESAPDEATAEEWAAAFQAALAGS